MTPHLTPGLYVGRTVHQRLNPKRHFLSYGLFHILLDIDRLKSDLGSLRLLSVNRFNLFSLYEANHGPVHQNPSDGLGVRMRDWLEPLGLMAAEDRIFLMTMPRILGFGFNPISLYFVQSPSGLIRLIIYEVNNTFGDRHSYMLRVEPGLSGNCGHIRQSCPKHLHVSPFMETHNRTYDFDIVPPKARFALKITLRAGDDAVLFASFTARRQALNDAGLWRMFHAMPLMTLKVVAAIHWEAVKLIAKGLWLKPKPPTPKFGISLDQSPAEDAALRFRKGSGRA